MAKVTVRSSPPPIYPLTITVQLNYLTYHAQIVAVVGLPNRKFMLLYSLYQPTRLYIKCCSTTVLVKFGLCQQHSTQLNNTTPNKFRDCWCNCTNNSPRPNHGGIVPTFKYCHVAQAFHRHQTIRQAPNQTESSNTLDDQRTFKTWTTQASGFVLFNFVSYN